MRKVNKREGAAGPKYTVNNQKNKLSSKNTNNGDPEFLFSPLQYMYGYSIETRGTVLGKYQWSNDAIMQQQRR